MIKTLDEFTTFLKICRKQGVNEVKFEGVSVSFGDLPRKLKDGEDSKDQDIPTDELSPEQLMFYSAGGQDS